MRMFVTNVSLPRELRARVKAAFPLASMSAVVRAALERYLEMEEEKRGAWKPAA